MNGRVGNACSRGARVLPVLVFAVVALAGCGPATPVPTAAPPLVSSAARPPEPTARCVVDGAGLPAYEGPCRFDPDARATGSFSIAPPADTGWLDGQVDTISVAVAPDGRTAEVRGLTAAGVNSRWGEATPAPDDPTCWVGADFRVCASATS